MHPNRLVHYKTNSSRPKKVKPSKGKSSVTKTQVRQMIASAVNKVSEHKFLDNVYATPLAIDYAGYAPFSVSDVPQGTSDTTRVGDQIVPISLEYSFMCYYNIINTTTNLNSSMNYLRILIFRWKPFYADVVPTCAKVFTYTGTKYSAVAPLTHDAINQFDVLLDKSICLDGITHPQKLIKGLIHLKSPIQYKAGSTTNGSGGIYLTFISDAVSAGGTYPAIQYYSVRLNYHDDWS